MRRRTPAEQHERDLARMTPGRGYDASAPVARQGPKGKVVPREPSDETPQPVVEGDGDPGDSGDLSDAKHDHPFTLSDAAPAKVDPNGAGSSGADPLPARAGHTHGLDISALTPAPITDDPGDPGNTGEVPDAGHKHHFDAQAAGIPEWDVDATPDTLALRSPTGTLSVAPPTAGAHAIPESETSVPPTADTIGRRNSAGQMEVAPSTAGTHALADSQATVAPTANAIARRNASGQSEVADATSGLHALNRQTGDNRYATQTALANHENAEGSGTHGAIASASPSTIALRDANGNSSFGTATNSSHAVTRSFGDGRYVEMSGDTMTGALRVPSGTAASPGLEVGASGLGLTGNGADRLDITTGGVDRVRVGSAGVRPVTAGLPLGLSSARWGNVSSDGVLHTTAAPAGGPAIHAPNGAIEGADFVTDGSLFADGAAFGMRSAQHVAVTGGTGAGQGIVMGVKTGGNLRVQVEAGLSYMEVHASDFVPSSDARRKVLAQSKQRDHLADVLATPTELFHRIEQVPIRPEGADERTPPTEIREVLGVAQLGWLANNVTPDVAVLQGSEAEGWEVGVSLMQQLAKLWEAFRKSHNLTADRLDALETR